jgi:hypothetical protein
LIYATKSTGAQTEINVKDLGYKGLAFVQVTEGQKNYNFKIAIQ